MKISPTIILRLLFIVAICAFLLAIVPPPTDAAPPQQGGQFIYYVNYGDTLFSIARRFGTTVQAIQAANGLYSDFIYVGQRLVVLGYPTGGSIYAPQPLPAVTRTPFPPGSTTCKYTVQSRDTVFSIAYRYQVTVSDLMQANMLYNTYLSVGQQLNVPCPTATPTPFPAYTVVAGDNLLRIAIRNNTTIYAIALVNGIPNPNIIYAGQTLVIPYPGSYVWPTGIPTATTPTTVNRVVIAEFRARGPNGGNDEFIELFNAGTQAFNVGGWFIKGSSNSGVTDTRATIPANVTLQSGQRYLIANNNSDGGYGGPVVADLTYTVGIADDGGIALTQSDGTTIVDAVGMSASSAYKEGTTLTPLTANEDRSYARKSNGCTDANDNLNDFQNTTPSGPQNLTTAAAPCASATATPTVTATLAPGTPTATPTQGATTAAVVMQNVAFLPNTLTLARGSTVTWTNIDTVTHTVSSGTPGSLSGVFRSNPLAPGQTFSFTFNNSGTFPYFCEIHGAGMTGTITIQ